MPRIAFVFLVAFAVLCTWSSRAVSQDSTPVPSTDRQQVDQLSREFKELVLQAATNLESPLRDSAIAIVYQRNYTDARFDDLIRQVMKVEKGSLRTDVQEHLATAISLMPHSTLSESEQVKLLLDVLVLEEEPYSEWVREHGWIEIQRYASRAPLSSVVARLGVLSAALADELASRISADRPNFVLFATASLAKDAGAGLLPSLLQAAKQGDHPDRLAALHSANEILRAVEAKRASAASRKLSAKTQMDRLRTYALRIIGRYDANNDQVLVQSEWTNMLSNPAAADKDRDGKITVEEYAEFMDRSRGKR